MRTKSGASALAARMSNGAGIGTRKLAVHRFAAICLTRSSSPYGQDCNNNAHLTSSMEGLIFTPTIWTATDACLANVWAGNVANARAHYRADALFSFNEPDQPTSVGGTALSIGTAVDGYRRLMQPYAGQLWLGAPATTYTKPGSQGGWSWLTQFLGACTGCQVDFIPIHLYLSTWGDVAAAVKLVETELTWLHQTTGKSIVINEMAYSGASVSEEVWFLSAVIDFFEQNDWIGRYSYRTAEQMTNADNSLTQVGYCYMCFRTGGSGDSCCLNT